MKTCVVNVRSEKFDVYIGRGCREHARSKWANQHRIGPDCTREQALERYERDVRNNPELMAALPELENKRLGCWCVPLPCHGHILVKLIGERKAVDDD